MLALLAPVPTQPQVPSDTARICDEKTQLAPSAPPVHGPRPRPAKVWLALGAGIAFLLAACILIPIVGFALLRDRKGDAPAARSDGDGQNKDKDDGTKDAGPYALLPPPSDPVLDRAQDGKPLKMDTDQTARYPATWVTFTPDGKRGIVRDRLAQFVRIFDLVDGVQSPKAPLQPAFDYENVPRDVIVSPDGKRILVPSGKTVQRRNGETYEAEPPPLALFGECTAIAFTPDSKVVATAERDGKGGAIRFWGAKDRAPVHKVIKLDSPVIGLSFSPDGQFLAVSSGGLADLNLVHTSNERIRIYRLGEDRPTVVLPGHEKSACWAGYLADGKRVFSVSPYDGTLRVWNVEDKSQIRMIQAGKSATGLTRIQDAKDPEHMVHCAYWPWGRALTSHRDGSLKLWDLDTGKQIGPRIDSLSDKPHTFPTATAISPGGRFALLAYNDNHLYLLRLPPPRPGKSP
jgi:WD40 repeat protein